MQYQFDKSAKLKVLTDEDLTLADKTSSVIVCNCGTSSSGERCWAYLAVKPSKYKELLRLTEDHKYIAYEEYGTVLKYGFGEEPPAYVKEQMRREFGWDDHYLKNIAAEVSQQQIVFLKEREVQEKARINDIVTKMKNQ